MEQCNLTDFLYKMKNHEKCKSHNLSLFFHYTTNSNSHIYKNFFLLKLVADWEKREKFIDWQIIIIINKCQWVSVFVCSLLQNGESKWAEILRDHSPWDAEGFRLKKNPGPVPDSPEKRKNERNATTARWLYTAILR